MPARLLFSTGSLYLLDTAQCFALAAEAGCDGIEVMCGDRWSTRDPHYLRTLSERYQMPILVVHTPFSQRVPGWRAPQRELAHIHLSNFDGREHRLPQCGQLDLRVFLRQLAMDNFGGTISLELHPDALAFQDAEACSRLLKESVDFCRTHLGST